MKKTLLRVGLVLAVVLPMQPLWASHPFTDGLFRYSIYGQSLLADTHPYAVRFDVAFVTNHQEWDWGQTGKVMRWHSFGHFGINLPLWSGPLKGPDASFAVTMPLFASIWLDLGEPVTAPVVNTDYRLALPVFTYVRHLNGRCVRNFSVSVAPFKHESTHLGDEITIQHLDHQLPLTRVNVSYNYSEYVLSLNEPDGIDQRSHTFRAGVMLLWAMRRGWYFINATDGDGNLAQPRFSPWEAYLQYQYQSPLQKGLFQYVASAEIRNRALYGYPEFIWSPETGVQYEMQDERRVFTYNVFLGLRFCNPQRTSCFSRASIGLRLYHGNNPFGQFRNHANYNHVGFCLVFE